MARSIRADKVPLNTIYIYTLTGNLPAGYSHETTLFGKHVIGVPDGATNPGTGVGANAHTHASIASHIHTTSGTAHTHSYTANPVASGGGGVSGNVSNSSHTHSVTSLSVSPTSTVDSDGSHTQLSIDHQPPHTTVRHIKRTATIISLRAKTLPRNASILWEDSIASIPSEYSVNSSLLDTHIKGVPDAGTAPLAT